MRYTNQQIYNISPVNMSSSSKYNKIRLCSVIGMYEMLFSAKFYKMYGVPFENYYLR